MRIYLLDISDYPVQLHLKTLIKQTIKAGGRLLRSKVPVHAEVNISLVSNERMQNLNRDFRGKDEVTDVLSFPSDQGPGVLGDIAISPEVAAAAAKKHGHSFHREICFLAIHGFLHLIGYDHEESEKEMFELQDKILDEVGISRDS